jgi:predicted homoserine dehydrogenase-like protein
LPIAISLDCTLKRDIAIDHPISYDDVDLPAGRIVDRLRTEQHQLFA